MKKVLPIILFLFSTGQTIAQDAKDYFVSTDTIPAEICYSYADCKISDTTFDALYNSRCIKFEYGYILKQYDGGILFFDEKKKVFAKNIVVWFWEEKKK